MERSRAVSDAPERRYRNAFTIPCRSGIRRPPGPPIDAAACGVVARVGELRVDIPAIHTNGGRAREAQPEVEFLSAHETAHLATIDARARPHVVPVGYHFERESGRFVVGGPHLP